MYIRILKACLLLHFLLEHYFRGNCFNFLSNYQETIMCSGLTTSFLIFLVQRYLFTDPRTLNTPSIFKPFKSQNQCLGKAWVKEQKKVFFLYHPPRKCLGISELLLINDPCGGWEKLEHWPFLPRKSQQSLWGFFVIVICISEPNLQDWVYHSSLLRHIYKKSYVNNIVASSTHTIIMGI